MGWEAKFKEMLDGGHTACIQGWECDSLVQCIREEHPALKEDDVRAAIGTCCLRMQAEPSRDQFIVCLQDHLKI